MKILCLALGLGLGFAACLALFPPAGADRVGERLMSRGLGPRHVLVVGVDPKADEDLKVYGEGGEAGSDDFAAFRFRSRDRMERALRAALRELREGGKGEE